jgi:hypothetical protein
MARSKRTPVVGGDPLPEPVTADPRLLAGRSRPGGMSVRWHGRTGKFEYTNGTTFTPLGGNYANFICIDWARIPVDASRLSGMSPFGDAGPILEFQDATEAELRQWLRYCRKQGINFLRLFSRGGMRPVQDPLDIGGQVNRPLWEKMRRYLDLCHEAGIYIHFVAIPEPRTSVYMCEEALYERILPHYTEDEIAALPEHRRRFLDSAKPRVDYTAFFTDPDVLRCHYDYLADLADCLDDHPAVIALEIYNEQQWADHFLWADHDAEVQWTAQLVERLKQLMPDLPVCCSFAGFGIAGPDPLLWLDRIGMDLISPHAYQRLVGFHDKADFACLCDTILNYTQSHTPTMMGEASPGCFREHAEAAQLIVRDLIWFSLLNNCPGFGLWMWPLHGESRIAERVMRQLEFSNWTPAPPDVQVDISEHARFFQKLEDHPEQTCHNALDQWCPHRGFETDHRYCVKRNSRQLAELYNWSHQALNRGLNYRFTTQPDPSTGVPICKPADVATEQLNRLPRPFEFPRHVQVKYLSRADQSAHIAYMRQYTYLCEGNLAGRTRGPARATDLRFKLPGDPPYSLTVIDLDTGHSEKRKVDSTDTLDLGTTDHDYLMIWRR